MIKLIRTSGFEKMYKSLVQGNRTLNNLIKERSRLFSKNPSDTRLKTHALKRHLRGKYAFSIDDDVRIIFEWLGKNTARFLAIGKHTEIYGGKKKW